MIVDEKMDQLHAEASRRLDLPVIPIETSPMHYHRDRDGFLHVCYHKCRRMVLSLPAFVAVTIISFPFEHWLYEKVYPFTAITRWLGL